MCTFITHVCVLCKLTRFLCVKYPFQNLDYAVLSEFWYVQLGSYVHIEGKKSCVLVIHSEDSCGKHSI